ncbi:MAG: hypothetical protein ACKO5P_10375 [Nodosilinea sp.]
MVAQSIALVVCGGFHDPQETEGIFRLIRADARLSQLPLKSFPVADRWAVLSGSSLRDRLTDLNTGETPEQLLIWAFSAGCLGAAALANYWQHCRGRVLALFMVDGWGVAWSQAAPLHRLSHDGFTHTTSNYLGAGVVNFVAHPAVDHRQLWRSPQVVTGHQIITQQPHLLQRWLPELNGSPPSPGATAADFLCTWSRYHLLRAVGDYC